MLVVTVVFIALVSGIYLATRENVLRNEQLYLKSSVLFAAGLEIPENPGEADVLYNEAIDEIIDSDGNLQYYAVEIDGGLSGYVVPASGPGLWGEIEAVIGFDAGLNRLTGVDFTKQNETPGLGARITEQWFRLQFRTKTGPFTRVPEGTESDSDLEFDAITGATITSTAVEQILNNTIEDAPGLIGRE
jgi:Na+-transporting NADH:ubiquinone oxidoreductase subunit C